MPLTKETPLSFEKRGFPGSGKRAKNGEWETPPRKQKTLEAAEIGQQTAAHPKAREKGVDGEIQLTALCKLDREENSLGQKKNNPLEENSLKRTGLGTFI